ncbi:hypothetical protein Rhe02_52850 [Rhizocola hellebori]|uniref:Lysozyme n=2 Tax=Rhizocola hellebori TaxID=1392758 RepID=A0A8J3QAH3_9ACTN|nr:hypothetical protein Rhe02_52850 [Rhizocola hellebori]
MIPMADDPSIPNVFGWDASDFDWDRGPMDLAAAARDGIQFFTHKATEATSTRHSHYGEAMRRARDAGIPILGAYHVVRSSPSVSSQVDYFLSYLDSQTPWWRSWGDWFLQVDLEKWPYDTVPASAGEAFADLVEQRTGRKAVIYASKGQYGNELTGTSHLLWNANYGTDPVLRYHTAYGVRGGDTGPGWVVYSGRMPTFWQYGSQTIIGNQPMCDANAFRGTLAELRALISGGGPFMALTEQEQDDLYRRVCNLDHFIFKGNAKGLESIDDLKFGLGEGTTVPPQPYELTRKINELLSRPPVQAAPIDQAAINAAVMAAMTNPAVLAAIAEAMRPVVDSELDEAFRGGADND